MVSNVSLKESSPTRRHVLKAAGVSLALPWLESFALAREAEKPPRRFCAIYFPFGVAMQHGPYKGKPREHADWSWFPWKTGKDFTFNKSLDVLEPVRDQVTVLGGLSHPKVREIGGHDSGDTFLTGEGIKPLWKAASGSGDSLRNTVSLDQFMARTHRLGDHTRFTSLVLSSDGGVGMPTRSNTLSYLPSGLPIPSLNRPALIFERLFGLKSGSIEAQRKGLTRTGSHLDLLKDEAARLSKTLSGADREKLEQYLTSVREVEQDVERTAAWLKVPAPKVNATGLKLDADHNTPTELIRTMLDLIVLAFQTDSTRFATYQLATMHDGISLSNKFTSLLGHKRNYHDLAHSGAKGDGIKALGEWDRYLTGHLHYFIGRLASIKEGESTLLDNTCTLYGSSNSRTHVNADYPLILAGGRSMGYRHGRYLRYEGDASTAVVDGGKRKVKDATLANLFVTIQKRMGVDCDTFADSTGEIADV